MAEQIRGGPPAVGWHRPTPGGTKNAQLIGHLPAFDDTGWSAISALTLKWSHCPPGHSSSGLLGSHPPPPPRARPAGRIRPLSDELGDNRPAQGHTTVDVHGRQTARYQRVRPGSGTVSVASGRRGRRFESCHRHFKRPGHRLPRGVSDLAFRSFTGPLGEFWEAILEISAWATLPEQGIQYRHRRADAVPQPLLEHRVPQLGEPVQ